MKYIYLVNRFQHKEKTEGINRKLEDTSKAFKRDYEIRINERPEDCRSVIKSLKNVPSESNQYVVTTIGGDGSINLLLNDLAGTDHILAFLPMGTGNDFCRACCETLDSGIHKLDMVRINDRYFINTACFGIDADIANDDACIHNPLIPRPLRYHAGVLYHFLSWKKGRPLKIQWKGKEIEREFTTVVAANFRYYGGGYRISPDSRVDDGLMEVYFVKELKRTAMARLILSMKDAGHLASPAVKMIRTDHLLISSDRPIMANIDGEPLLSDHFDLELIKEGIRLDFDKEFIDAFVRKKGRLTRSFSVPLRPS